MNDLDSTIQLYKAEQSKYTYYIIALSVAGIGFSVSQTMDRQLELSMWPLGLSLLLFAVSIYSGLKFIKFIIIGISLDIQVKQIIYDQSEYLVSVLSELNIPYSEPAKREGVRSINKIASDKSRNSYRWLRSQNLCFYFAVISFIAWRVWEMYLKSVAC